MKVISYSLFGDPTSFEFGWYLRGIYYNARMNRIFYPYPDFQTVVYVDERLNHEPYSSLFDYMYDVLKIQTIFSVGTDEKCKAMLWRMKPLFIKGTEYVICRDADSVCTYREASCVYEWLYSNLPHHGINDNDAHGGLMGGLVGFKREDFLVDTKYTSFDQMVSGLDLKAHGTDQNFLNRLILPKIKNKLFFHKLKGAGAPAIRSVNQVPTVKNVSSKLWVTDLISRYIGSAGVIDMELMRFFRSFAPNSECDRLEKEFPQIFYWNAIK